MKGGVYTRHGLVHLASQQYLIANEHQAYIQQKVYNKKKIIAGDNYIKQTVAIKMDV